MLTLIAFPLQQWLHESASVLRHNYIAFLVIKFHHVRERSSHSYKRRNKITLLYFLIFIFWKAMEKKILWTAVENECENQS
jgi:hypothetical protein